MENLRRAHAIFQDNRERTRRHIRTAGETIWFRMLPMAANVWKPNRLIGSLALGDLLLSFREVGLVGFWCFLPFGRAGTVVQFRQDREVI